MLKVLTPQLGPTGTDDHRIPGACHVAERLGESLRIGRRIARHEDEGAVAAAQGGDYATGDRVVMRSAGNVIRARPNRDESGGGEITGGLDHLALRAEYAGPKVKLDSVSTAHRTDARSV